MVQFNPQLEDKEGVLTFSEGTSLRVNIIVLLQFKLIHYDVTVHYTTGTPHSKFHWAYVLVTLTYSLEDKGVHTFPKGISPKLNFISRLEFELAYFKAAVLYLSHHAMGTPSFIFFVTVWCNLLLNNKDYKTKFRFLSWSILAKGNE